MIINQNIRLLVGIVAFSFMSNCGKLSIKSGKKNRRTSLEQNVISPFELFSESVLFSYDPCSKSLIVTSSNSPEIGFGLASTAEKIKIKVIYPV